jgi:hypothetical protein
MHRRCKPISPAFEKCKRNRRADPLFRLQCSSTR